MIHLLSFVLCLTGFAALALAMDRPQRNLLGQSLPLSTTAALRVIGTVTLLAAMGVLVVWQGWALGLVMFSGHTSLGAGIVHAAIIAWTRGRARVPS